MNINKLSNEYIEISFDNNTVDYIEGKITFDPTYRWLFFNTPGKTIKIICNSIHEPNNNSKCEILKQEIKKYFKLTYEQFTPEVIEELTNFLLQYKEIYKEHYLLDLAKEMIDEIKESPGDSSCVLAIQESNGTYEIMTMPAYGEYLSGYLNGIKRGGITNFIILRRIITGPDEPGTYRITDECNRVIQTGTL